MRVNESRKSYHSLCIYILIGRIRDSLAIFLKERYDSVFNTDNTVPDDGIICIHREQCRMVNDKVVYLHTATPFCSNAKAA